MIVVATDAPLDARNLERLAARAIFALARTGSTYSNGSGDFAIAFSTHPALRVTTTDGPQPRTILPTDGVSGLFEAVLDATEEAVYNSHAQSHRHDRQRPHRSAPCRSSRSPRCSRSTDDEAHSWPPRSARSCASDGGPGGTVPDERRHRVDLRDGQRRGRPARARSRQGRLHGSRQRHAARNHALLERDPAHHRRHHARHEREHVQPVPPAANVDAVVRRRAPAAGPRADRILRRRDRDQPAPDGRQAGPAARAAQRAVADGRHADLECARRGHDRARFGVGQARRAHDHGWPEHVQLPQVPETGRMSSGARCAKASCCTPSAWTAPGSTARS